MFNNFGKTITTISIWMVLFGVILAVTSTPFDVQIDLTAVSIAAMIIALAATFILWILPFLVGMESATTTHQSHREANPYYDEKAKRGAGGVDKIDLLLAMMDDDERAAFKSALQRRILEEASVGMDGELSYHGTSLNSLEAMLDERNNGTRS